MFIGVVDSRRAPLAQYQTDFSLAIGRGRRDNDASARHRRSIAGRAASGAGRAQGRVRRRAGRWWARSATCRTRGRRCRRSCWPASTRSIASSLPCDTLDAQWRLGVPAASLDRARRRVVLSDGDEVAYDRLILATGSRARRWPGAGARSGGGARAPRPRRRARAASRVRRAAARRDRGRGLHRLRGRPDRAQAGPRRHADRHRRDADAAARPGARRLVRRAAPRRTASTCASGPGSPHCSATAASRRSSSPTASASPPTSWSSASARSRTRSGSPAAGCELDPGLECDATLTAAGDPDILGAGDIVSWPHPLADGEAIRIEHWTVAAEQGQLAGRNALRVAG